MTALSPPPPEGTEPSEGPPPPPAAASCWFVVSYSELVGEPASAADGTASATMASAKAIHNPHLGRGRWPTNRFNMLYLLPSKTTLLPPRYSTGDGEQPYLGSTPPG